MTRASVFTFLVTLIVSTSAWAAGDEPAKAGTSSGAVLLFWAFALATVGGGIFVISRRNLITAVMAMVGTFLAIAVLYVMLFAHFLAAIQILVYAGAIMVLFVFVIMILNKPEDESTARVSKVGLGLGLAALAYIGFRLASALWKVKEVTDLAGGKPPAGFGSTDAMGTVLFREYIFPFEAVSLVLLAAVVGAIAVARPGQKRQVVEFES